MQNRYLLPTRISSFLFASAVAFSWSSSVPALASANGPYQLRATEQGAINKPTGLGRNDVVPTQDDAFSGGDQPPGQPDFSVKQDTAPPPRRPFPLSANDQGGDGFDPRYGQGTPGQLQQQTPTQQMPGQMPPQPQFQMQQADPDSLVAWDEWHRRVATAIYERYSMLTRSAGYKLRHTPLQCDITYVVTCQGQIINTQVQLASRDPIYNTLCMGAITSLSGNFPVLQFPPGSRRQYIEMPATFSENITGHNGLRFTQGDQETVHPGRR